MRLTEGGKEFRWALLLAPAVDWVRRDWLEFMEPESDTVITSDVANTEGSDALFWTGLNEYDDMLSALDAGRQQLQIWNGFLNVTGRGGRQVDGIAPHVGKGKLGELSFIGEPVQVYIPTPDDPKPVEVASPDALSEIADLATENDDVYKLLALCKPFPSWGEIYIGIEIIEHMQFASPQISKGKIGRIAQNAQRARHRVANPIRRHISLGEARYLFNVLVSEVISSRLVQKVEF